MNLDLSDEDEREVVRRKLAGMTSPQLEKLLGELYQKRYVEQDINYESYYRLASSVYVQKQKWRKDSWYY